MILEKITIYNFRSIKELELKPEPRCQIFVGEIEAGKSNLLKAISYLSKDLKPNNKDIREPADGENIEESYIDYDFSFTDSEQTMIYDYLKGLTYNFNEKDLLINQSDTKLNFREFLNRIKGYVRVDFENKTRTTDIFDYPSKEFESNWKIFKSKQSSLIIKNKKQGKEFDISKFKIINSNDLEIPDETMMETLTVKDLEEVLSEFIIELINKKIPNVIFWEYNEKNLLPSKVNLADFCENPASCSPLKAMFDLQGITNIKNKITEAIGKNRNSLRNLLKRVARTTTKHFQTVWPDYKGVEFSLEPDGENMNIAIRDRYNDYDLSDRSNGFKRFVTFLLLISAKNKSNILKDSIIIVDEPEIGLHIKGQRYLRDELINISNNNLVFYSTHSIFMIDKHNIERHYIVKKEKEITGIKGVNSSNYMDEEVIFNALGYSIFEALREFNIIFEGWTDKRLFEVALSRIPSKYSDEVKCFKEYGTCFSNGVKTIKSTSNILDLVPRLYAILSDGDKIAKDEQKLFSEIKPNVWKRYDEIFGERIVVTSEDFIKVEVLKRELDKILQLKNCECNIEIEDIATAPNGRIKLIENRLRTAKIEDVIVKNILHDLKENIFRNLKYTQIEEDYYDFLKQFKKYIELQKLDKIKN